MINTEGYNSETLHSYQGSYREMPHVLGLNSANFRSANFNIDLLSQHLHIGSHLNFFRGIRLGIEVGEEKANFFLFVQWMV